MGEEEAGLTWQRRRWSSRALDEATNDFAKVIAESSARCDFTKRIIYLRDVRSRAKS